ncbi:MAG: methyltransferase [Maritimibacter sp.]
MSQVVFFVIFAGMVIYTYYYSLSVRPAHMEQQIGAVAYPRCATLRRIAFAGMGASMVAELLYVFFPLDIGLPLRLFGGLSGWAISIAIGLIFTGLGSWILIKVGKAAPDSFAPRKENQMYGGIYEKIRHPQAIADVSLWFAIGFLLNSPLLVIVALLWVPQNIWLTYVEESDLKLRFGQSYIDYMARTGRFLPQRG